ILNSLISSQSNPAANPNINTTHNSNPNPAPNLPNFTSASFSGSAPLIARTSSSNSVQSNLNRSVSIHDERDRSSSSSSKSTSSRRSSMKASFGF
ncbi:MAG: hypothetical protein ACK56F_17920, partial [bacterium]